MLRVQTYFCGKLTTLEDKNRWPDFSGQQGVLVSYLWFFMMHINFAWLSHFYFLKIIIYKVPNLKNILGSYLSPLDWSDL